MLIFFMILAKSNTFPYLKQNTKKKLKKSIYIEDLTHVVRRQPFTIQMFDKIFEERQKGTNKEKRILKNLTNQMHGQNVIRNSQVLWME